MGLDPSHRDLFAAIDAGTVLAVLQLIERLGDPGQLQPGLVAERIDDLGVLKLLSLLLGVGAASGPEVFLDALEANREFLALGDKRSLYVGVLLHRSPVSNFRHMRGKRGASSPAPLALRPGRRDADAVIPILVSSHPVDQIEHTASGRATQTPRRTIMADLRVLVVTDQGDRPETGMVIKLHEAGVAIKVLCWEDCPYIPWLSGAGVPFEPLRLTGKRDRAGAREIARHLDEYRPHVLHLLRKQPIFNGLAAARGRPVRIVVYRGIVGNVSFLNLLDWMSFLNPRVDRIVCVAEAVRQEFLRLGFAGLSIPPEKLVTIHKGHDLDWYRDPPADLGEFGIPSSAFVVNCVANVRPRKGIRLFIDACASLPADLDMHFLLIGRGMDSPELLRRIARSPHPERFHVLGFRSDAPRLMAASDVSVLPSLRREGLPRSIVESMSYGTTPVVSDAGGSPELVEHGRSGLVVPAGDAGALGDALASLRRDPDRCRELGGNARNRIACDFNVEITALKTLELYRELTAQA